MWPLLFRGLKVFGRTKTAGPLGISTEVVVTGPIASLGKLTRQVGDRVPIHRKIAIQLYGWVIKNFDAGGANQTPPWVPLSEKTREQKRKLGYSLQPLLRTGNLRQSFAPFSDENLAGVGARASAGVDYARVHETGSGNVPQRSMLPPKEWARDTAIKIYQLEITRFRKESRI